MSQASSEYDELSDGAGPCPHDFTQNYEIHTFGAKGGRPCGDDVIQTGSDGYRAATTCQVPPKALTPSPLAEPLLP